MRTTYFLFFFFITGFLFAAEPSPTFHRDVEPILQRKCQSCHRPGEAAPFALVSYDQARPWAKAIRNSVIQRKMPPWHADPHVGKFVNDRSLSEAESKALIAWVDGGAPRGDAQDAPKPAVWPQGWTIGQPDAVFEMPGYDVPATGIIGYQWVKLPTGFTEDKWVQAVECRPADSARPMVHHIAAVWRRPDSPSMKGLAQGTFAAKGPGAGELGMSDGLLADYVPGMPGLIFPAGKAMLLPAGADILLQIHYTPTGKAVKDRSKVGLIFAKEPPAEAVLNLAVVNGRIRIPPGDPHHRVDAAVTFNKPVKLLALNPHMHLRGKSFTVRATLPDNTTQRLLNVPRYDFNWQTTYETGEVALPEGTRLEASAWFDNSPNNPWNPDPKAEVIFGDQTTDEMMVVFTHIAVPHSFDRRKLLRRNAPATSSSYDGPSKPTR
ncbi:MAG: cytochrome c [Acidobacteria bacterium]|nr:cytochrome c [Acidobacteriota bacterium]